MFEVAPAPATRPAVATPPTAAPRAVADPDRATTAAAAPEPPEVPDDTPGPRGSRTALALALVGVLLVVGAVVLFLALRSDPESTDDPPDTTLTTTSTASTVPGTVSTTTTTPPDGSSPAGGTASDDGDGITVSGVAELRLDTSDGDAGAPPTCESAAEGHRVQVSDDSGTPVAVTPLVEGTEVDRTGSGTAVQVLCEYEYWVKVSGESGEYTFALLSGESEQLDSRSVASGAIGDGAGPRLAQPDGG